MSTTTSGAPAKARTYGNFVKPSSPGIGKLGLIGTCTLMAGAALAVIVQTAAGLVAGIGTAALVGLAIAPLLYTSRDGRNGWQTVTARVVFTRSRRSRRTIYAPERMEPLVFAGPTRLPGLMARSSLLECVDSHGQPFGVLVMKGGKAHYSVVIRVDAEGAQLVDQDTIDVWVARWGHFLADLGDEPNLIGASVTVETAPDPGHKVAAEVHRLLQPGAPTLSAAMLTEAAENFPTGSAEVTSWVAITWAAAAGAGKRLGQREMVDHIGNRLPGLLAALRATGAGMAIAMDSAAIAERVRSAYDPDAAPIFAELRAAGQAADLAWDEVGAAAVENWASYRHGESMSITWRMVGAPKAAVQSTVLVPLLGAHRDLLRKRVTVLYRPHTVDVAASVADKDVRTAAGRAQSRKGVANAGDARSLSAAEKSAAEQAGGAGLVRFGVLVTATTNGDLARAEAVVTQLGASARLRLRKATGSQAAGFQAALGVGLVLSAHTKIPSTIGDQI